MSIVEKLNDEIQKNPTDGYLAAIGEYLIDRCADPEVAAAIEKADKPISACLKHVTDEARKRAKNGTCVMSDSEVFGIVCRFYGIRGAGTAPKPAEPSGEISVDLDSFLLG